MKVVLIYKAIEERVEPVTNQWGYTRRVTTKHEVELRKEWTRKHTFIHRTQYSNELWQFGERRDFAGDNEPTWFIDLRPLQLGPANDNSIVSISRGDDRVVHFDSSLSSLYEGDVVWSDLMDRYCTERYAVELGWNGEDGIASQRWARDNNYQPCGRYGWLQDPYEYDLCWPEDTQEWMHCDDAYWSERDECWYADSDNCNFMSESADHINEYHHSPCPADISEGAEVKFGYEVEKTYFMTDEHGNAIDCGDYVGEYEIFKGFETDSSCGVEAITHILDGTPDGVTIVNGMVDEAAIVFNSPWNERCGGHVTISVKDHNGQQLLDKLRGYMGVVYAMFDKRLSNEYCSRDKKLLNQVRHKYRVMNVMDNRIEIRLPDAVRNAEEFKLRHKLFVTIVDYALNDRGYLNLLKDISKDLSDWYAKREQEVDIESLVAKAMDFRLWLTKDEVTHRISSAIDAEALSGNEYAWTLVHSELTENDEEFTNIRRIVNSNPDARDLLYRQDNHIIRAAMVNLISRVRSGESIGTTRWRNLVMDVINANRLISATL